MKKCPCQLLPEGESDLCAAIRKLAGTSECEEKCCTIALLHYLLYHCKDRDAFFRDVKKAFETIRW